jgi:hypothetical protein
MMPIPARYCLAFLAAIAVLGPPCLVHAALTFDLRAVSAIGTDVELHNAKTITVSQASTDGAITFELWGIVTGANADLSDDLLQIFVVRALSSNQGIGAIRGDMSNEPRPMRGLQSGYDQMPGTSHGSIAELDGDGDLDIGGPIGASIDGYIAGRDLSPTPQIGAGPAAEFLAYRFVLSIDQITAATTTDQTVVEIQPHQFPTTFRWEEDFMAKHAGTGQLIIAPGVTIAIPEPGTIVLTLFAFTGAAFALRFRP